MAEQSIDLARLSKKIAIVRIVFGAVWVVDAAFKFDPNVYKMVLMYVQDAASGQPQWLKPWFDFWQSAISINQSAVGISLIVIECLIAASLLFGFARRLNYILASIFCLLVWSIAEGFGGPYASGSTDIGAACMYIFVFALLFIIEGVVPSAWSLDAAIGRRISWWKKIAGPTSLPNKAKASR